MAQAFPAATFPSACVPASAGRLRHSAFDFQLSRRRSAAAFTLVEVMMAATVIVVAFFGMISALTAGSEMMATARRQTLASKLIDYELERLRILPWSDPNGSGNDLYSQTAGPITINSAHPFYSAVQSAGATFTVTRAIQWVEPTTLAAAGSETTMKEVTVTASWTVNANWKVGGTLPSRTYNRSKSAFFGKFGLNLSYRQ